MGKVDMVVVKRKKKEQGKNGLFVLGLHPDPHAFTGGRSDVRQ
jgi:hypothetical protein